MSQPSLLELAKQGNAKAIATLLNRSLQPKGVTVKATVKDTCLQVMLESEQIPDRTTLVPFIRKGLVNLHAQTLSTVKVYGQQTGMATPSWTEKFELEKPQLTADIPEIETHIVTAIAPIKEDRISQPETTAIQPIYRSNQNNKTRQFPQTDKTTYKDVLEGIKIFLIDPVGGLPIFFFNLGKQRALGVGIAFGIVYAICILLAVRQTPLPLFMGGFKIVIFCIIQFASIVGASALVRILFRGNGSFEGDIFIAGASLLSPGLFLLLGSALGIRNIEIIIIIGVISCVYTILALYAGCHQISAISETKAPLAVASMLIVSTWLSKVIVASLIPIG